jgi:hypothetical protein
MMKRERPTLPGVHGRQDQGGKLRTGIKTGRLVRCRTEDK